MARRNQPVLGIIGDGGFTVSCQALWSAARYQVPVTLVVINNHGYRSMRGSVLKNSPRAARKEMTFDFEWEVDIPLVARGFGVECHRVEDPADLAEVLRRALRSPRPEIVEVMTSSVAGAIH
jgi:benzoylformate decarboxylase